MHAFYAIKEKYKTKHQRTKKIHTLLYIFISVLAKIIN